MGGFFGVASKEACNLDLFYGTDYHSHLGTRRGGIYITVSILSNFNKIILKLYWQISIWVLLLSQSKRKEVPDEKGNFKKIFF